MFHNHVPPYLIFRSQSTTGSIISCNKHIRHSVIQGKEYCKSKVYLSVNSTWVLLIYRYIFIFCLINNSIERYSDNSLLNL